MEVITITRYKFDGKEYDSIPKVKTEIENRIGAIIDKMNLPLKARLKMLEVIVSHKAELCKLLEVTHEFHTSEGYKEKNVLDL